MDDFQADQERGCANQDPELPPEHEVAEIDWRCYEECLRDTNMTDQQKQEFIETMWSILISLWGTGYSTRSNKPGEDES